MEDPDGLVQKYFESELKILYRLRPPNIVSYLDFDEDPERNALLLYMEYCEIGDLETCHGWLSRQLLAESIHSEDDENSGYGFFSQGELPQDTALLTGQESWSLVIQLASALAYLHYGLMLDYEGGMCKASFGAMYLGQSPSPRYQARQRCDAVVSRWRAHLQTL